MAAARLGLDQLLVLSFLLLAWLSLVVILAIAPEVFDQRMSITAGESARGAELVFFGALTAFIVLVGIGVLRRWRLMFWLLMVAFLAGIVRVPASILELAGWIPASGPNWYVVFQALIGAIQFAIGLVMAIGYRRHGVWGGTDHVWSR